MGVSSRAILSILSETSGDMDRLKIVHECVQHYEADPGGELAPVWLRGLFRFDAERAAETLAAGLTAGNDLTVRDRAIEMFASLFGDNDSISFEINDPAQRARVLDRLVRIAFAVVRPGDDQIHEGVHSVSTRDMAETARNSLLSMLLRTPGLEAQRVILSLAEETDFGHFPDRLRLLARHRAAEDAELLPFSPQDVADLEIRYEAPPRDRDGLFSVMMDRLDDLAHDICHHDYTDRRTLASITAEIEMQRTLALRIGTKANGAFLVARENEVADQKRTDIHLSAVRGNQKAVIEVKLAENWSLADFERALRDQLVGQYLTRVRPVACC